MGLSVAGAWEIRLNLVWPETCPSEMTVMSFLSRLVLPAIAASLLVLGLPKAVQADEPTNVDLGRIMFLGNSFIEGHYSDNLSWQGGSRKVIEDILIKEGATFSFVGRRTANSEGMKNPAHNGFGGKGIDELFNGVEVDGQAFGNITDWLNESLADIYIIDIGRKTEEGSTKEELKTQFMRVVKEIYAATPSAKIIWSEQTIAKPEWYPGIEKRHDLINEVLKEIASEQAEAGRWMKIAEVAGGWDPLKHLDTDGVHASDAGYLYLGQKQAELLVGTTLYPVPEPGLMLLLPAGILLAKKFKKKSA